MGLGIRPRIHQAPGRLTVLLAMLVLLALALPVQGLTPGTPAPATPSAAPVDRATVVDPVVETGLRGATDVAAIVQLGQVDAGAATRVIEAAGGEVSAALPIVDGLAARVTAEGLEALRRLGVAAISFDGPLTLAHGSAENRPAPDATYADTVGATQLHRKGLTGSGVGIAVIDTGVSEVGDLRGRVTGGVDLTIEADGADRYGHGTFVAGVAAGDGSALKGKTTGVAPGAHVVPVKIAGANGAADVSHVLAALQWVVSFKDAYDIGVVNLSLGTDSTQDWRIDPLNYAVERAWDAGIVVVVSASNLGPDSGSVTKPADDPWVISVGATDGEGTVDRSDDTMTSFSGRGPTRTGNLAKPDLVAPGAHILGSRAVGSTIDASHPEARVGEAYLQGSGTSFATAAVSGAVALLRQAHPDWTPDQIKGALLASAAAGPTGDRNVDGYGALDVLTASRITSPVPANQGLARSDGTGSLAASRGTLQIELYETTSQVVETVSCVEKLVSGGLLRGLITTLECTVEETVETVEVVLAVLDKTTNLTAQNQEFDGSAYRDDPWTADSWSGSRWYGSRWYGSRWYGSRWYGSRWYGSRWY